MKTGFRSLHILGKIGEEPLFKWLFFSLLAAYCLCYAPYGVNETDGGFVTGLAWQTLQGKTLYGDVVYVRPPLPVWLRAAEMLLLPDRWAILGERCIFYLKVGLYSWLGASVLLRGQRRWALATFGFVVSAHCYPPMAWHTVDGILFSVAGIWCATKLRSRPGAIAAVVCVFAAALCKQSFYPVPLVLFALLLSENDRRRTGWGSAAFFLCTVLFVSYLYANGRLANYLALTGGAAEGGQALRHGLIDYFRIRPGVALLSLPFLTIPALYLRKGKYLRPARLSWYAWIVLLAATYAFEIWRRQEFTAPFAQARLMFWLAALFGIYAKNADNTLKINVKSLIEKRHFLTLLAVCWCASVSWGYNLPILFSTPWVFAAMEISRQFQSARQRKVVVAGRLALLLILLAVFRLGYEFVYRDGRRSDMRIPLGAVFPRLGGLYSRGETAALYLDLKNLTMQYPNFKTLPSFPLANYLTGTRPPLPLDWVVKRESGPERFQDSVVAALRKNGPVLLIEKRYADGIETDPELRLTRRLLHEGLVIDETPHFWVVKWK